MFILQECDIKRLEIYSILSCNCVIFITVACISFSELENDTLNQAELNEIKINENNLIFEVPGLNENPSQRTLIWP
jgi:hypothetical protein